jgi:hypothetical protein
MDNIILLSMVESIKNMINTQTEKADNKCKNMCSNDINNFKKYHKQIIYYLENKYQIIFSETNNLIYKLIIKFTEPKYGYDGIYVILTPSCVVYIGIVNFENPSFQAWNFESFQNFLTF